MMVIIAIIRVRGIYYVGFGWKKSPDALSVYVAVNLTS